MLALSSTKKNIFPESYEGHGDPGLIGGSLVASSTRDREVPGSNPSSCVVDCEK